MKQETYFSQLDGIRFVAVALVLIDHWLAEKNVLPLGHLGVTMFFVLSGFLITRILIQSKLKDDKTGRSHWFSVKQFIIRRSIRIFPIYFLAIFVLYALDIPPVRDTIWWCLTYTTNIYIATKQHWMGTIDHLWSLAVEEQYYLFFPYLILFLSTRHYLKILSVMIILSIVLRMYFYFQGAEWMVQYVLMPTCLDCFGLGGLMAYFYTFKKDTIFEALNKNTYLLLSFGVLILTFYLTRQNQLYTGQAHNFGNLVVERFIGSVFCFFLIMKAVCGYSGFMKVVLENSIISYFGRISYGLYLYHNFVYNYFHTPQTSIVLRGLHKIQKMLPSITQNNIFELLYFFGITVFLATLSWFLIEKPVNNLKKYFTY
ncbi:MAG: acyltransferase [Arcicella sp.]|nr:acyltransferase [Arcicella sp.]